MLNGQEFLEVLLKLNQQNFDSVCDTIDGLKVRDLLKSTLTRLPLNSRGFFRCIFSETATSSSLTCSSTFGCLVCLRLKTHFSILLGFVVLCSQ